MLDHIALLVIETEPILAHAKSNQWEIHDAESFPGEGTRETYISLPGPTRLLLMQSLGEPSSPYEKALNKRGPGLHHIALEVNSIELYLATLSGTGWYLHPKSIETFRTCATVWMTAKDAAFLVEVHQTDAHSRGDLSPVTLPAPQTRLDALGVGQINGTSVLKSGPFEFHGLLLDRKTD